MTSKPELPPNVVKVLETAYLRINGIPTARILWERLSEPERRQLGGDFKKCYVRLRILGMWMALHDVSQPRAIADVALELGFLDDPTYRWLLREMGEAADEKATLDRPHWQGSTGTLRWGRQVIRRIRVLKHPSNIQVILDAFQATGWSPRIKNPLSLGQQQLHQTLRSLNRELKGIRFHAQQGAKSIFWEKE